VATINSMEVDTGLPVLSSGVLLLHLHLMDSSSLLIIQVLLNNTSNHLPKVMANILSSQQVVIPLAGSSAHPLLLHSRSNRPPMTSTGSKASRSIKPLREQQLPQRVLGMDTISKAIIKVTSNSLLKLLHMEIQPQHMLSKVTHSRHMLNPCTVDTRMLSLLRVISKHMVSKVSKDTLHMDNPKLGTLLQLVMGLLQLLLVATIIMLLLLEVPLQFQSASLQLCLPPKAKGKW
jgi:hypothetical protein